MQDLYANYPQAMTLERLEEKIGALLQAHKDPSGFVNVTPSDDQYGKSVYLVDSRGRYELYK